MSPMLMALPQELATSGQLLPQTQSWIKSEDGLLNCLWGWDMISTPYVKFRLVESKIWLWKTIVLNKKIPNCLCGHRKSHSPLLTPIGSVFTLLFVVTSANSVYLHYIPVSVHSGTLYTTALYNCTLASASQASVLLTNHRRASIYLLRSDWFF